MTRIIFKKINFEFLSFIENNKSGKIYSVAGGGDTVSIADSKVLPVLGNPLKYKYFFTPLILYLI